MRVMFTLASAAAITVASAACHLDVVVSVDEKHPTKEEPGHSLFYATADCMYNVTAGPEGTCAVFGPSCDATNPRKPRCSPDVDTGGVVMEGKFIASPVEACGGFGTTCFVCNDAAGQPYVRLGFLGAEEGAVSADPLSDEKPWSLLPDVLKLATNKPGAAQQADDELVYPLPEVSDIVTVLVHALHCRNVTKEGKVGTEMEKMHTKHCGEFHEMHTEARSKLEKPSEEMCAILFGLDDSESGESADYLRMVGLGGSYSYGYLGGKDIDHPSQDYLKMVGLAGDYSYGYLNGNQGRDWLLAQNGVVPNARGFMPKIAGYGYGNLLMKAWRGNPALTTAEQMYLDSWKSPLKVKQGALAYACSEYPGFDIYASAE